MGFFSRFFKLREQDPSTDETTWAVEENGSELVLDPEYAATLMMELDIDAAIASHEGRRRQLEDMVLGRTGEVLRLQRVCENEHCELGRWISSSGRERLGHYPAFGMLEVRHRFFHQQAALVAEAHQASQPERALKLLNGSCRHASNQVLLLLKELKRGLGR